MKSAQSEYLMMLKRKRLDLLDDRKALYVGFDYMRNDDDPDIVEHAWALNRMGHKADKEIKILDSMIESMEGTGSNEK